MSINNNELFVEVNKIRDDYDAFLESKGYPEIIRVFNEFFDNKGFEVDPDRRINQNKTDQFFIKVEELSNSGVEYDIGVNVELGNVNRGYDIYYFCAIKKGERRTGDCKHGLNDLSEYLINNLNSDKRWNYNAQSGRDNHLVKFFEHNSRPHLKFIFLEEQDIKSKIEDFAREINTCIERSKLTEYK